MQSIKELNKNKGRISVFCVTDYYIPGYLGGGPITTLYNMRYQLLNHVDLSIYTRDRDLGGITPYDGIKSNEWTKLPDGPVFYTSPNYFGWPGLIRAKKDKHFDVIYLNSFFSYRASISIAIRGWLYKNKLPPILLAPRGEFSRGALSIKSFKKKIYLAFSRFLGIYRNIHWHASTQSEAADIIRVIPDAKIHTAADLVTLQDDNQSVQFNNKKTDTLQIIFISRISPKKNLDGLLKILTKVNSKVDLDVYGPQEDSNYWKKCLDLSKNLPRNVKFKYCGELTPNEINSTFKKYDLFAFPTHGENFGHVIFESLCAGTPVITTNETPWKEDPSSGIRILPPNDLSAWKNCIEEYSHLTPEEFLDRRQSALRYAKKYLESSLATQDNLKMFFDVAEAPFKILPTKTFG
ncbi:glycosyltransferase family 4 protein [Malikia granosa]|uniref:Glycosyl transferase family 1 domain-containing protein n=1 Tax=Malikia granosa TaxID=263067 RepID=A0A2S9K6C6_9BURK|nr:glycosyltransferase [Malikia granosa]PRD66023.1 hypothetical protein C6P64_06010 [Malikia granosa]